ncbi:hypothetical protein MLD38_019455 [Melastoma candidum]|uniref:Uncharacterized protein n=1 Tax=Melastoma candidum TaxID=119954 RepID=A0ACB9QX94_9MYRT|nr:hypothetical protein MLD38_019455 [Melastoma candidum]
MDARHGAKTQDEEGRRLKFQFQYLSMTIKALWKARSLSSEQKVNTIEDESESKSLVNEENRSILGLGGVEDVSLSEVHSSTLGMSFFMEVFSGEDTEYRIMEKAGCLNYSCTPWESEKPDGFERQVYFRFNKRDSHYRGEVTSSPQKSHPSENTRLLEEAMTLNEIPVGEYVNLHLRYQIAAEAMQCESVFWHRVAEKLEAPKEDLKQRAVAPTRPGKGDAGCNRDGECVEMRIRGNLSSPRLYKMSSPKGIPRSVRAAKPWTLVCFDKGNHMLFTPVGRTQVMRVYETRADM